MPVEGIEEMLTNVKVLEENFDKKARKAVNGGAKLFGDALMQNTPVSKVDHSGKGPLQQHMKVGNVSVKSGDYEAPVGYDKVKGPIAHFPNSGTSKQEPQHFIEETQAETKDKILQTFKDNLQV